MGTSLSGLLPQDTYQGLLKFGDNSAISASLKVVSDGAGNNSLLYLSTSAIAFGSSSNLFWDNTNSRLGIGTSSPSDTLNVVGTTLLTQATGNTTLVVKNTGNGGYNAVLDLFERTNGNLYFGGQGLIVKGLDSTFGGTTTSLGARVGIKGSGSTSATTSFLVQNSGGSQRLKLADDGLLEVFYLNNNPVGGFSNIPSTGNYGMIIGCVTNSGDTAIFTKGNNASSSALRVTDQDVGNSRNHLLVDYVGATGFNLPNGTKTVNVSAQVEIVSTTKGFLPPRMTTTQKNAISSPATGLQVFDTTMNATCEYTGTAWRVVSAGSQALAAPTASTSVDLSAGNVVNLSLTSSTTLTFTGAAIGTYIMRIIQGGSGSYTITWPASVIWSGGTAPTLTTTVAKSDIVTLIYDGTNYYGNYSLNY